MSNNTGVESPPSGAAKSTFILPEYDISLLKRKGYTIGQPLNSGSFSTVCKAFKDKEAIAVKIIDMNKTSTDYQKHFLPRELYTMNKLKTLNHPNIITVHDMFYVGTRMYVFMDLAEGGDVLDLVTSGPIPEDKSKILYRGVAEAIKYIHEKGLVHRDIKSENILLNKDRTVAKIADFGFARTSYDHQTGERLLSATYCGSAAYAAPELLKAEPYNAMISDVWSMGVVLYVMLNNRLPFKDRNLQKLLKQQMERSIEFMPQCSEEGKDLILKHLDPNTKTRYTMAQVLEHPWLRPTTQ